jgi:hypothetical protein
MMKFNSLLPVLVSGITLSSTFLAGVLPAPAVTLDYSLNGTFVGGGTLSGTFSADSVTQSLINYSIITTAGSGFPGFTYQFGVPGNRGGATESSLNIFLNGPFFGDLTQPGGCTSNRLGCGLNLQFDGSIFDPPSSGVLNVVSGSELISFTPYPPSFVSRLVDSGTATTQPIPEPLSIIGTLIGGGAVWRMRKKLTASTKVKVKQ